MFESPRAGSNVSEFDRCQTVGRLMGSEGISIAPALDTAAAVTIAALRSPSESLLGPKSPMRTKACATIATDTATVTCTDLLCRRLLRVFICCLANALFLAIDAGRLALPRPGERPDRLVRLEAM